MHNKDKKISGKVKGYTFNKYITDNKKAVKNLLKELLIAGNKTQLVAPTGTGKTTLIFGEKEKDFVNIVDYVSNNDHLKHYNIIVLTPLQTLAQNTWERAKHASFAVVVGGKENAQSIAVNKEGGNRIVCTYKQAAELDRRLEGQSTLYIIDELPEVVNAQYQQVPELENIIEGNNKNIVVGLTATPHQGLFETCWNFETYQLKASSPNKPKLHIYNSKPKNFIDTVLSIVKDSKAKIMAFANEASLCKSITDRLSIEGISAEYIHAQNTKEEKETSADVKALNETKEIKSDVLSTTSYLSIGVDGKNFDIIYIANHIVGNNLQHLQQAYARSRNCKNVYLILQDTPSKNAPKANRKSFDIKQAKARVEKQNLIANVFNQQQESIAAMLSKMDGAEAYRFNLNVSARNKENDILYKDLNGKYKASMLIELNNQLKQINRSTSNAELVEQIEQKQLFSSIEFKDSSEQSELTKAQKEANKQAKALAKVKVINYAFKSVDETSKHRGIDVLSEYVYNNTEDLATKNNIIKNSDFVAEEKARGNHVSNSLGELQETEGEFLKERFRIINNTVKNYCNINSITSNEASNRLLEFILLQNTSDYSASVALLKAEVRRLAEGHLSGVYLRSVVKNYDQRESLLEQAITKEIERILSKKEGSNKIEYLELYKAYKSVLMHSKYKPIDIEQENIMRKLLTHLQTIFEVEVNRKKQHIKIVGKASILDHETKERILNKINLYKEKLGLVKKEESKEENTGTGFLLEERRRKNKAFVVGSKLHGLGYEFGNNKVEQQKSIGIEAAVCNPYEVELTETKESIKNAFSTPPLNIAI